MGDIDKIQQNALMDRYVLQVWNKLHTLVLSCVLWRSVPYICMDSFDSLWFAMKNRSWLWQMQKSSVFILSALYIFFFWKYVVFLSIPLLLWFQVQLLLDIERTLPLFILKRVQVHSYADYPNANQSFMAKVISASFYFICYW